MNRHLPLVDSSRHHCRSITGDDGSQKSYPQALLAILRNFEEESVVEYRLVPQHSLEGTRCPKCYSGRIAERLSRRPTPYRRRDHQKQFSVRSYSAMQGWKLPLSVRVQASHLCSAVSNADFGDKILTVAQKKVRTLARRISEACAPAQRDSPLGEPDEADATSYESPVRHGSLVSFPAPIAKTAIEDHRNEFFISTWTILQEVTRV